MLEHDHASHPDLPFEYLGGNSALDLVNTADWTSRGPEQDRLSDYDRLTRWAEGAGLVPAKAGAALRARAKAHPGDAESAYRSALRARAVLERLFGAIARGEAPHDALDDFNALLARALRPMRVVPPKKGRRATGMQLGWEDLGASLDSVIWPAVWSGAELLVSDDAERIRVCGGVNCGWMYVDRSRNGLRRWCSMGTCGTREKSRRRYQRTRRTAAKVEAAT
jgi:predicted RNA-binding Zn ribbon-like protein